MSKPHGVPFSEAMKVWARVAALSFGGPAGQLGQALNAFLPAGWALVDGRLSAGDGLRVGRAIGVAAAGALRLRQQRVDLVGSGATGEPVHAVLS